MDQIINPHRFSTRIKLLRVTTFVFRFISQVKLPQQAAPKALELSAVELMKAKQFWIRAIQSAQFEQELASLRGKQRKITPRINQFGLFIKIIRHRKRLTNSTLQLSRKNPIRLPASHYFVELLIIDIHLHTNHCGTTEGFHFKRVLDSKGPTSGQMYFIQMYYL